jgi:hypothetical protein
MVDDSDQCIIVPAILASLVADAFPFRTIDGHARAFMAGLPWKTRFLINAAAIEWLSARGIRPPARTEIAVTSAVLEVFQEAGFLISRSDWTARMRQPLPAEERISTLGIMTSDREPTLLRCIRSFAANALEHNREPNFAVYDDAPHRSALEAIRTFKQEHGTKLLYAGADEKRAFIAAAEKAGVPPHVLHFCLFGEGDAKPTTGANRNAFLLDTAGELAFSADDDTLCQIYRPSPRSEEVVVESRDTFMESFRSYGDFESAAQSAVPEYRDILALHESVLNGGPSSILERIERMPDDRFSSAIRDPWIVDSGSRGDARLVLSLNGSLGDSGSATAAHLLSLAGKSRDLMLRNEAMFQATLTNRYTVKSVPEVVVRRPFKIMSMFYGINNRFLVPPFFPLFRQQDALFGLMTSACVRGACIGYLPWMLVHRPDDERSYAPMESGIGEIWPKDLILHCLDELPAVDAPLSTENRLWLLGMRLKIVGSMGPDAFESLLRTVQAEFLTGQISALTDLLDSYPHSRRYWINAVKTQIELRHERLVGGSNPLPEELRSRGIGFFQRTLFAYGELLEWWPRIMELSKELKARGIRLARAV